MLSALIGVASSASILISSVINCNNILNSVCDNKK